MKKYCPGDQNEQHFFKYFLILPAVFEKIAANIVVCSILGADELLHQLNVTYALIIMFSLAAL